MKFYFTALAALLFSVIGVRAQTTAFTYQGQLSSNSVPATGSYDFRFQIFNAGSVVVAGPLTNTPVGVTNGLFAVTLDFGPGVFDGSLRTLEIGVRTNGDTRAYTVLSPRQQITSTPYAIRALNAANATNAVFLTAPLQGTNIAGIIPVTNLPPNVAFLNSNQTFTVSNTFNGVVTANNSTNVFSGAFTGNGAGLTNVPATSLTGTIPDARLSTNVAQQSNPDLNFAGTVSATNFTGAGHGLTNVPGAFFWVTVSNTSTDIHPNTGYIATNDTIPAILTLPESPSVGDVYKVAGVGAGGWIIAQNTNQMIAAGNLAGSIGQSWRTNGPTANWSSVAASANGTIIAATITGGGIYVSTNSGATWTARASALNWSDVAVSADGTKMAATVGGTSATGYIWTSTDSGVSWTRQNVTSGLRWISIASSADGTNLVAAVYNGYLFVSSNSGTSWTQVGSSLYWTSVASSADGTRLVAVANGGQIYTSTNSGSSWVQRVSGSLTWATVASSSDGRRLVAAVGGTGSGSIYLSTDSGATWAANTTTSGTWSSVASSSDGSRLAAVSGTTSASGNIYTSTDSGATWPMAGSAPGAKWLGVASSSDGSLLAAVAYGGNIYVSSQASTTTGTAGYLFGAQHTAIELIYAGNYLFLPLSHEGTIRAY
jgi:hypothetical protein